MGRACVYKGTSLDSFHINTYSGAASRGGQGNLSLLTTVEDSGSKIITTRDSGFRPF